LQLNFKIIHTQLT